MVRSETRRIYVEAGRLGDEERMKVRTLVLYTDLKYTRHHVNVYVHIDWVGNFEMSLFSW
jgi:hypothetical protein